MLYDRLILNRADIERCKGKLDPWWPVPGGVSGVMNGQGITPSAVRGRAIVGDGLCERVYVQTVSGSVYELGKEGRP